MWNWAAQFPRLGVNTHIFDMDLANHWGFCSDGPIRCSHDRHLRPQSLRDAFVFVASCGPF